MFLQILWPLECFSTKFALVRFQRNVDSDVGGDVITLDRRGAALSPSAGQIEVVGRLSSYVSLAHMVLNYELIKSNNR